MSLKRLIQQNRNANHVGYCLSSAYAPGLEATDSSPVDNRRSQAGSSSMGTLWRDYKQLALSRTSSSDDSLRPQRKLIKISKEDNESFGFEIQTLRFQHQSSCFLETCTYICKVKEGGCAYLSGLQSGYILASINGVSTEGLSHKKIVESITSSGNILRLVVVNEALIMKRMQLETKLHFLKKTLQEKLIEFQSLCLQELHLTNGKVCSALDSEELEETDLPSDRDGSAGFALAHKPRFSSQSSCLSQVSSMTVDSEDSFYQACVSGDPGQETFSRQSSIEDDCFLPRDTDAAFGKVSLRRNRSISVASNGSRSPSWEATNVFGTLPRKSRKGSVRKRLLKFIPGLHRAVEEEESRV